MVIVFLASCNAEEDYDIYPSTAIFELCREPIFRNINNNQVIQLKNDSYACFEVSVFDAPQIDGSVHSYHHHQCGEVVKINPHIQHQTDHTLISLAVDRLTSKNKIRFAGASFTIPDLSEENDLQITYLHQDTTAYQAFALAPDQTESYAEIDSIYYSPDYGMIRIKCTDGNIWEKVK